MTNKIVEMKKGIIALGFIVAFLSMNAQTDSSAVLIKKGVHTWRYQHF
jgi:hypothetical protein